MEDTGAIKRWMRRLGYALLPILVIGGLAFVVHAALSAVLDLSLLPDRPGRSRAGGFSRP